MSFKYIIPIIIIIISNVVYHNTAKNIPKEANSFLSLAITYFVGVIIAIAMYCLTSKPSKILTEIHEINWTSYVLGISIVGVEIGYMYMYRAGWDISKGSLIANILVAIVLIIIGILFYKEHIGVYQIVGIICCIVGLIFINFN
ncbi:EamA family transporter [Clostridium saccharobutylicum]|nr:EamA family transporter [Clostridium saccharobutylicum]AQR91970.1 EamA-like transporter family protein [Clostridium saccharobutylicum]AQS01872.1 EamA-like transporter family protein [Clostridium saccharobutylicum]AQS11470.1 EamA-like transporter family protein [Clostridium saccharobutylicum]AQS15855.1 EamA-like transporter family protein [Clostridium saccharobutylicum]MBA2903461.1 drug/metabolite transporter (DMT)-like permease [Clostridium saccharobutylicum]